MTVTANDNLMLIATDSSLRVHERIKKIKGVDKKISSVKEAKAILAIPSKDLIWTDNKDQLCIVQMEANNYLEEHKKQLQENKDNKTSDLIKKGKNTITLVNKGIQTIKQIVNFANNLGKFTPLLN